MQAGRLRIPTVNRIFSAAAFSQRSCPSCIVHQRFGKRPLKVFDRTDKSGDCSVEGSEVMRLLSCSSTGAREPLTATGLEPMRSFEIAELASLLRDASWFFDHIPEQNLRANIGMLQVETNPKLAILTRMSSWIYRSLDDGVDAIRQLHIQVCLPNADSLNHSHTFAAVQVVQAAAGHCVAQKGAPCKGCWIIILGQGLLVSSEHDANSTLVLASFCSSISLSEMK